MAARVSWLVANRIVAPEEILGLTFTRKAASELNERVRLRLGALARHPDTDADLRRAAGHRPADRLDLPRLRGRAGRRARAADRRRARRRRARPGDVLGAGGDRRRGLHRRHERRPADAAHHGRGRAGAGRRPRRARHQPGRAARLDGAAGGADRRLRRRAAQEGPVRAGRGDARPAAGAGGAAAAGRGVRGAQARGRAPSTTPTRSPTPPGSPSPPPRSAAASAPAGRSCCSTSTRTPASASCGCSRRCSAATPATRCSPSATRGSRSTAGAAPRPAPSSASTAPSPACPAGAAERLTLATSWRNDDAVLAVANAVSGMLPPPDQPLPDLAPAPTAGRGAVTVGLYDTVADETEALADRLAACWLGDRPARRPRGREAPDGRGAGAGPQAAARHRRRAARARPARSRSSGSAGCSRCPRSPTSSPRSPCWSTRPPATRSAGCSPVRAGGSARATWPPSRRGPGPSCTPGGPARADGRAAPSRRRPSAAASSRRSTTSAVPTPTRRRATAGCGGSAAELAHLRTPARASRCPTWSTRWPAPWAWRPSWPARPGASPAGARAHLDALHGVAAEFTELAELPSLPAFLGYLRDAEERERGLEPGEVAVNPEAVQLLTGHSAKGLEWDVVAVPGLTVDQFPSKTDTSDSWIRDPGAVPADLRLTDREELPRLRLPVPGSGDQAVVKAGARGLRPGVEGLRARPRRSASATSRSPAPGTCCSARAAGGATA